MSEGDHRSGNDIPMGASILKVALDFDILESSGKTKIEAFDQLKQRKGWYDPKVIEALKVAFPATSSTKSRMPWSLNSGMA